MREVYFGEFRVIVIEHIRGLAALNPQSHTTEWFLLKYLKRIAHNANPPTTRGRMENCMRGLIRFYVDNIEENSPLGNAAGSSMRPMSIPCVLPETKNKCRVNNWLVILGKW